MPTSAVRTPLLELLGLKPDDFVQELAVSILIGVDV